MENAESMDIIEDNYIEDVNNTENGNISKEKHVYLPGKPLGKDEELVCDESAYVMIHQAHTGAPCLSFDIIKDELGNSRDSYPLTAYMVAGTQASRIHTNSIIVMKMFNLHRSGEDSDTSESDDDDAEDTNKRPEMRCALIKHQGCVNRVRSTSINNNTLAASWSELGRVNIWKLNDQLQAVEDKNMLKQYEKSILNNPVKPLYTFGGHQTQGYAIDWSNISPGVLASGDCKQDIHIWQPLEGGTWKVDQRPLVGHSNSVEDIQWSPNEANVLASCSVDKSIRIWDCRAPPQKACMLVCDNSHKDDVNVISWNRNEPFIVSGGDDGFLHVWDLRQFETKKPVATFKHHSNFITTVEWHPTDSTVFASGGKDDQIAIWDLAVESDNDININDTEDGELKHLPPQLLFIHQGQEDIKELHWHPQIPGVILSTAHSGFNIFKTISV